MWFVWPCDVLSTRIAHDDLMLSRIKCIPSHVQFPLFADIRSLEICLCSFPARVFQMLPFACPVSLLPSSTVNTDVVFRHGKFCGFWRYSHEAQLCCTPIFWQMRYTLLICLLNKYHRATWVGCTPFTQKNHLQHTYDDHLRPCG